MSKLIGTITDKGKVLGDDGIERDIAPEELEIREGDIVFEENGAFIHTVIGIDEPFLEVMLGGWKALIDMQNVTKFPLGSKVSYDLNENGFAINLKIIE